MPRHIIVGLGILGVWAVGCGGQSSDESSSVTTQTSGAGSTAVSPVRPGVSGTSGAGVTPGAGGMAVTGGASGMGTSETAGMPAAMGAPAAETATCDALACEDGELSGTWRFVEACPVDYAVNSDTLPPDCAPTQTHDVYSGTLTFNADGTVTENYTVASSQSRIISTACAQATNVNADLSDVCAAFNAPENQFSSVTACSYTDGSCLCDWSFPSLVNATGAYSREDYCLQGDALTFAIKVAACDQCAGLVQVGTTHLQRVQ